jgi:hypothetical protein
MSGTTHTFNFIGSTDPATGVLWTIAANWQEVGVAATAPPGPADAAVVNTATSADILNGASVTVGSLSIGGTGPGGTVIVGGSQKILPAIDFPGVFQSEGGTLTVTGAITVTSTIDSGALVGGRGGLIKAPTLTVAPNVAIGGGGTFDVVNLVNNGLIVADGGRADLDLGPVVVKGGSVTGNGVFEIAGPSTLEIASTTTENIVVDDAAAATIILDSPDTFTGGISLGSGSHLDLFLQGKTPTGATLSTTSQALIITGAAGTIETIPFVSAGAVTFTAPTSTLGEVSMLAAVAPVGTPPVQAPPVGTPPVQTPPVQTPPVQTPPAPDPSTVLGALDTTTNQPVVAVGDPYPGPVAGLQHQYINTTSDGINITASSPNWFIHSGSGEDAIAVSSGTNVLDGGTGSNFLTGGSGTDTFFVDDRAATADIWSTVVGFHAGDAATIWGVTPQDFGLNFVDGQGAAGFTGLTLHATAAGKPTASLTLTGYSQADLNNGRLTVQFGTEPVSGSSFMFVHGNS